MKKTYQKPEMWAIAASPSQHLLDSSVSPWVEGKETETPWDYIEEEDELDSKFSWSVWGDDEDEEDV